MKHLEWKIEVKAKYLGTKEKTNKHDDIFEKICPTNCAFSISGEREMTDE